MWRSASRLSPEFLGSEPKFAEPAARGVRRKASQRNWCLTPITRCAERLTTLILQVRLVRDLCKPSTLVAEGDAVSGVAKLRRSPRGGGHSRSHPLRRPRPTNACVIQHPVSSWGQS